EAKYIKPASGDRNKLLQLSQKNAATYLQFLVNKIKKTSENENTMLLKLKNDLKLDRLPLHIECFDNSNIQGDFPVSACVVFKNGKPAKSEYRHFHVKSVTGPDDYATMREIVYRRYARLIAEGSDLPQLIVIDGGKGQLNAACEALRALNIYQDVAVIGIAKKLEEIYRPGDPLPLYLDKRSSSLRLIQHLRDEAHRFGLSFHRRTRDKKSLRSLLDTIPGIGEQTKSKLLKKFGSIYTIRNASLTEISELIGQEKANSLLQTLDSFFEF
ncbi:MAG: helix-hairpin-helix domain-containing protein, partial [Bacteroidales bacterium]